MPKIPHNATFEWETVEVPFAAGVDLRDPARAVQAPRLLALENGRFEEGTGVRKRRGHKRHIVRTSASLAGPGGIIEGPSLGLPGGTGGQGSQAGNLGVLTPPPNWLYGVGPSDGTVETPDSPDSRFLAGMAKRDNEVLAWDGHRLFSWNAAQEAGTGLGFFGDAALPSARTEVVAKTGTSQRTCDVGVGNNIIVVAWTPNTADTYTHISVYDYTTRAPLLVNHTIANDPAHIRVMPMGEWVHILVADTVDGELRGYSIHESKPWEVGALATTLGTFDTVFDCKKITDSLWAVVKVEAGQTKLTYLDASGATDTTFCAAGTILDTGSDNYKVSVAFHPQTGEIALAWHSIASAQRVYARVYTKNGVALGSASFSVFAGTITKITVGPTFRTNAGQGVFYVYVEDESLLGSTPSVTATSLRVATGLSGPLVRIGARLASHAWRVGDKPFVMLCKAYNTAHLSKLQYSYYIADVNLKPVGRLERGTAPATLATGGLPSMTFYNGQDSWNKFRFAGPCVYRERLDSVNTDQFDEESIKLLEIDFLPRLRVAQLGRTAYIAGAQLHAYDGREVVEAGFHEFPENVTAVDSTVAGTVKDGGVYGYRVRWAHKNAQGEEVVSAGLAINSSTIAADRKIDVTIPTLPWTRRSDVYALVYRRNPSDTQYYLVSNRDPSVVSGDNDCPVNDTTVATITFRDDLSGVDLTTRERDPGNAGELESFSAPASEVIAAGRDRLWLAGGEITPGTIMPSKLVTVGNTVGFNSFLQTAVDRAQDPITAVGFMGHSIFVFRRDKVYAFEADGPSNLAIGSFDQPRVILADTGAAYPEGMALVDSGLVFVSPAGFRMLATNYQLVDIGDAVKEEAAGCIIANSVLVQEDQELRFYRLDGPALVFDLKTREWATWPHLECAGAVRGPTGLAILGRFGGDLWEEQEDLWTDADSGYVFKVRTAWLRRDGLQNAQRVRAAALLGDYYGNHSIRVKAYYDDRDFPEDDWTWNPTTSGDFNSGTWGDSTWGDGVWGDTDDDDSTNFIRDRVYSQKHGLAIQKCARVSFELTDGGTTNEGPAFTALALEVGRRAGLTRLPARTTT